VRHVGGVLGTLVEHVLLRGRVRTEHAAGANGLLMLLLLLMRMMM